MYNGSMFEQQQFPANTQDIYQEIEHHLVYLQTC
jgi:hypothetical protein